MLWLQCDVLPLHVWEQLICAAWFQSSTHRAPHVFVQRVTWLNGLVSKLWPSIKVATKDSVIASISPLLTMYR